MKYKLVIFDLDLTLLDSSGLYPEVLEILEFLKSNNVLVALASCNASAYHKLRYHGIEYFFQHVLYENWNLIEFIDWKYHMLSEILSLSGIPSNETVFFDDNDNNLNTARSLGITPVEVNPKTGVSMELIKKILQPENEICLGLNSSQ